MSLSGGTDSSDYYLEEEAYGFVPSGILSDESDNGSSPTGRMRSNTFPALIPEASDVLRHRQNIMSRESNDDEKNSSQMPFGESQLPSKKGNNKQEVLRRVAKHRSKGNMWSHQQGKEKRQKRNAADKLRTTKSGSDVIRSAKSQADHSKDYDHRRSPVEQKKGLRKVRMEWKKISESQSVHGASGSISIDQADSITDLVEKSNFESEISTKSKNGSKNVSKIASNSKDNGHTNNSLTEQSSGRPNFYLVEEKPTVDLSNLAKKFRKDKRKKNGSSFGEPPIARRKRSTIDEILHSFIIPFVGLLYSLLLESLFIHKEIALTLFLVTVLPLFLLLVGAIPLVLLFNLYMLIFIWGPSTIENSTNHKYLMTGLLFALAIYNPVFPTILAGSAASWKLMYVFVVYVLKSRTIINSNSVMSFILQIYLSAFLSHLKFTWVFVFVLLLVTLNVIDLDLDDDVYPEDKDQYYFRLLSGNLPGMSDFSDD